MLHIGEVWRIDMRVLWVCNIMLPIVAKHLNKKNSNKEGWLSGLSNTILENQSENGIELGVAFPVEKELNGCSGEVNLGNSEFKYYGFYENTVHAEIYEEEMEASIRHVIETFNPDIIHCFGTEYAHTLAVCRVFPHKNKILVGIQGLISVCAEEYMAHIPEKVQKWITFRDWIKKDTLVKQQEKFAERGKWEIEVVKSVGNITGRTDFDRFYTSLWNSKANYYLMNETLRHNFYEGKWNENSCEPYDIFLSQGDYPIKGLHYMLLALPQIRECFPKVRVLVAGNSVVKGNSLLDRIKTSAYGKYLKKIIKQYNLNEQIVFLGSLTAEEMKAQYLKSGLYVCCSALENSPNSLGEAMLLGMPCVSADVGGIPSLFVHEKDGILYKGHNQLAEAVIQMWSNQEKKLEYCSNAREHAKITHDMNENYKRLLEIYAAINLQV